MAFTGPLEDRIAIRELYDTYADATFQHDLNAYLACWHDDGARVGQGIEVRGKDALSQHWLQSWAPIASMTFFTQLGAIEVDGDHAKARCYCLEKLDLKAGAQTDVVGRYEDELLCENGRWLFVRKHYSLLMHDRDSPLFKGRATAGGQQGASPS